MKQSTVPTLEQTIARIQSEILLDISRGVIPASVGSFSELHDYVDANEYGGFCEDVLCDALIAHFGGRDENEGMPDGLMNYMNAAQDAIDTWIKNGGIAK